MMSSSAASGSRPIASILSVSITLPSGSEDPPEGRGGMRQSSAVAENGIFRLTSRRHVGEDQGANRDLSPALPDMRPAPYVAGFRVSGARILLQSTAGDPSRHGTLGRVSRDKSTGFPERPREQARKCL